MKISQQDVILIKNVYLSKGYGHGAHRLLSEFPNKSWEFGSIDTLLKKIRRTGTIDWQRLVEVWDDLQQTVIDSAVSVSRGDSD